MGAIHWSRGGTLKVYAFAVVATAMARAFELVLACLPIGSAAEMSTAGVNYKEAVRSLRYPDAILLLPFGIDTKCIVTGRTDPEST